MATNPVEIAPVAAVANGGTESVGMPQLDFSTFPNQIFWLVVSLVVIHLILKRVAIPRIGAVLSERQGTITNDIAAAEELKLKAQDAEAAYDKALADARVQAQKIIAGAKAEMQAGLDEATVEAEAKIAVKARESEARIAEIREGAMQSVTEVAKDTAKAIVSALGQTVDGRTVTAAVNARLKG